MDECENGTIGTPCSCEECESVDTCFPKETSITDVPGTTFEMVDDRYRDMEDGLNGG